MARPIRSALARLSHWTSVLLFSRSARPARFVITGGLAGLLQLSLLKFLLDHGWNGLVANAMAFLLAAQLNFVLSSLFTWRDRLPGQAIGRRWLVFHASIATMAVVNMAVFAVARTVLPDLAASAFGICVAAIGNFFIGDRLVFRGRIGRVTQIDDEQSRESAA
jgi:putative flippase GtrA